MRVALADRLEAVASPDCCTRGGRRDWESDAALFDADQRGVAGRDTLLIEAAGLRRQLAASRGALVAQKRAAVHWVANLRKELAANRLTIDSQNAALAAAGVDLSSPPSPATSASTSRASAALSHSECALALTPLRSAGEHVRNSPALVRTATEAFDIKLAAAAADEAGIVSSKLERKLHSALGAVDATRAELRATASQLERAHIVMVEATAARGAAVEALHRERAVATARLTDASSRYDVAQRCADQLAADKASLEALVAAKSEAVTAHATEASLARDEVLALRAEAETLRAEARAAALARGEAEKRLGAARVAALCTSESAARTAEGFDRIAADLAATRDREAALAARLAALAAELAEANERSDVLGAAVAIRDEAGRVLRVELAERAAAHDALRIELAALEKHSSESDGRLGAVEEELRSKRDALAELSAAHEIARLVHAERSVELGDVRQRAELAEEGHAILAAQLEAEQALALAASRTAEETVIATAAEGARLIASAEHTIARMEREAVEHDAALETARGRAVSMAVEERSRATAAEGAHRLASAEHTIARMEREMSAQAAAAQTAARTAAEQQNAARELLEATNAQRAAAAAELSATTAHLMSEAAAQHDVARAQARREIALVGALQTAAEVAEIAASTSAHDGVPSRVEAHVASVVAAAQLRRRAEEEEAAARAGALVTDEATMALKLEMTASEMASEMAFETASDVQREMAGNCAVAVTTVRPGVMARAPAPLPITPMVQPRLPTSHFADRVARLPSAPPPRTRVLRAGVGANVGANAGGDSGGNAGGDGANDDAQRGAAALIPASAATKALFRTDWTCKLNLAAGSALDFVVSLPLCKSANSRLGSEAFGAAFPLSALPSGLGFALSWQLSVKGGAGVTVGVMCATDDEAAAILFAQSKGGIVAPVTPPGTPRLGESAASTPLARGAACASSATVGRSSIPWSEFSGVTVVRPLAAARAAGSSGRVPTTVVALSPATRIVVLRFEHKGGWCVALCRRACRCIPALIILTASSLSPPRISIPPWRPPVSCIQVYARAAEARAQRVCRTDGAARIVESEGNEARCKRGVGWRIETNVTSTAEYIAVWRKCAVSERTYWIREEKNKV